MTIETILTDKEILAHMSKIFGHERASSFLGGFALARAIEQAVLQSEQVQAWKRDAERLDWLDMTAHCADWMENEPTKRVIRAHDGAEFTGDTWRAAINAAMMGQK